MDAGSDLPAEAQLSSADTQCVLLPFKRLLLSKIASLFFPPSHQQLYFSLLPFSKKAAALIQRQTRREKVWIPVPGLPLRACGCGKQMCFGVDQTLLQTLPPTFTAM